jgi:hypothetical protein
MTLILFPPKQLRTPEDIVTIGYTLAPVVMMNEAHAGERRCIRTRLIGQRILPIAHRMGVRHLFMEALDPICARQANETRILPQKEAGYLAQPELRLLAQTALDLRWTLVAYEAFTLAYFNNKIASNNIQSLTREQQIFLYQHRKTLMSVEYSNWREEQQAINIISVLSTLPKDTKALIWCGNGHLYKRAQQKTKPMGFHFQNKSGITPFVIDQTLTVQFISPWQPLCLSSKTKEGLQRHNKTAGYTYFDAPWSPWKYFLGIDACLLSLENALE